MDIIAYVALHFGGTLSQETGPSPLAVYSSTTVYLCQAGLKAPTVETTVKLFVTPDQEVCC